MSGSWPRWTVIFCQGTDSALNGQSAAIVAWYSVPSGIATDSRDELLFLQHGSSAAKNHRTGSSNCTAHLLYHSAVVDIFCTVPKVSHQWI
mmetsp:Transcript_81793/g.213394  ORF Transcript_81793/g.213394 Transcript_81793/m.213394 type:complete len:91 (-) Transcript_81793:93-365(-)